MSARARRRLLAATALALIGVVASACAPDGDPADGAAPSVDANDGVLDGTVLDVRRDPG